VSVWPFKFSAYVCCHLGDAFGNEEQTPNFDQGRSKIVHSLQIGHRPLDTFRVCSMVHFSKPQNIARHGVQKGLDEIVRVDDVLG